MDDKDAPDLETLNQLYELGNDQIRRTFDLYLELIDKLQELQHGRAQGYERQTDIKDSQ